MEKREVRESGRRWVEGGGVGWWWYGPRFAPESRALIGRVPPVAAKEAEARVDTGRGRVVKCVVSWHRLPRRRQSVVQWTSRPWDSLWKLEQIFPDLKWFFWHSRSSSAKEPFGLLQLTEKNRKWRPFCHLCLRFHRSVFVSRRRRPDQRM